MANHTNVTTKAQGFPSLGAPRIGRRHHRRRGLETVEMAIILPLLLLLIAGIIEYGWMFLKFQETTNACRQGARVAARADAAAADYEAAIDDAMAAAGLGDASYTVAYPEGAPVNAQPGEQFAVRITLQYNPGVTLGMPLVPKPPTLTTTITMMKEGV